MTTGVNRLQRLVASNTILLIVVLDMVARATPPGGLVRAVLNLAQIAIVTAAVPLRLLLRKDLLPLNVLLGLAVGYMMLIGVASSDIGFTYNYVLKYLAIGLCFLVGYGAGMRGDAKAFKQFNVLMVAVFVYLLTVNIFGYGEPIYEGQRVSFGDLDAPLVYVAIVSIVLYVWGNRSKQYQVLMLPIVVSLFVLFVGVARRTFILLLIAAVLVYVMDRDLRRRHKKVLVNGFLALALFYPAWSPLVAEAFEVRQGARTSAAVVLAEPRILEHFWAYEQVRTSGYQLAVGSGELFNSKGRYGFWDPDRYMHADLSRLLFGGGLILVSLYLAYTTLLVRYALQGAGQNKVYSKYMKYSAIALVLALVPGSVTFLSFKGALLYIVGYGKALRDTS